MTTKLIVIAGFLVAFSAGVMTGVQSRPAAPHHRGEFAGPSSRPSRHSVLAAELNLTAEQQQQLNQIWSETARRGRGEHEERRRQCRKDRDDAVAALIRTEDRAAYDKVMKNYSEGMAALEQEWRASYQAAVERTKQILTPAQREKYEELLKRNQWDNRRAGDRATTRPASEK